jgi:hypothetical protein
MDMITLALQQNKTLEHYFMGGDTFKLDYHPKTKIPTLSCIAHKTKKTTYKLTASTLTRQPSYKGHRQVMVNETNNTITPAANVSNVNTTQQHF